MNVGILLGFAVSVITVAASSGSPYVLTFFLCFFSFIFSYIRAKYPKWNLSMVIACLILIIAVFAASRNPSYKISDIYYIIYSCFLGVGVSLVMNGILWPRSASGDLRSELELCLLLATKAIDLTTEVLFTVYLKNLGIDARYTK
jgi:hypothetical protein